MSSLPTGILNGALLRQANYYLDKRLQELETEQAAIKKQLADHTGIDGVFVQSTVDKSVQEAFRPHIATLEHWRDVNLESIFTSTVEKALQSHFTEFNGIKKDLDHTVQAIVDQKLQAQLSIISSSFQNQRDTQSEHERRAAWQKVAQELLEPQIRSLSDNYDTIHGQVDMLVTGQQFNVQTLRKHTERIDTLLEKFDDVQAALAEVNRTVAAVPYHTTEIEQLRRLLGQNTREDIEEQLAASHRREQRYLDQVSTLMAEVNALKALQLETSRVHRQEEANSGTYIADRISKRGRTTTADSSSVWNHSPITSPGRHGVVDTNRGVCGGGTLQPAANMVSFNARREYIPAYTSSSQASAMRDMPDSSIPPQPLITRTMPGLAVHPRVLSPMNDQAAAGRKRTFQQSNSSFMAGHKRTATSELGEVTKRQDHQEEEQAKRHKRQATQADVAPRHDNNNEADSEDVDTANFVLFRDSKGRFKKSQSTSKKRSRKKRARASNAIAGSPKGMTCEDSSLAHVNRDSTSSDIQVRSRERGRQRQSKVIEEEAVDNISRSQGRREASAHEDYIVRSTRSEVRRRLSPADQQYGRRLSRARRPSSPEDDRRLRRSTRSRVGRDSTEQFSLWDDPEIMLRKTPRGEIDQDEKEDVEEDEDDMPLRGNKRVKKTFLDNFKLDHKNVSEKEQMILESGWSSLTL